MAISFTSCNNSLHTPNQTETEYEVTTYTKAEDRMPLWESYMSRDRKDDGNDSVEHMLCERIGLLIWDGGHIFEDFDDITAINDVMPFQFTIIMNMTLPIFPFSLEELEADYPTNPYTLWIKDMRDKGIGIDTAFYIDDVNTGIASIFGKANPALFEFDGESLVYCVGADVDVESGFIYFQGGFGYAGATPLLLSYEKTMEGYICEATILPPEGKVFINGSESEIITKNNYDIYKNYVNRYRYKFECSDDGLILTSFKTLYIAP